MFKINDESARTSRRKYYRTHRKRELAMQKKHRQEHPEVRKNWKERNPDKVLSHNLKAKYGITYEQFKSMLKKQKGLCAICKKKEIAIDGRTGKIRALSVDHDHKTRKVRKLLCRLCNIGIGVFRESPKLLQAAFAYLKTFKGAGNG